MSITADPDTDENPPKKASKLPLLIGLVLALAGGAGGFFAAQSGLLPFVAAPVSSKDAEITSDSKVVTEDVTFIALDPITVTFPPGSSRQLLRVTTQLDVAPYNAEQVEKITPRIVDILNSYLRAVQVGDVETPTGLIRLRTQMLHRAQVVAGEGVIRDLLITEFILN